MLSGGHLNVRLSRQVRFEMLRCNQLATNEPLRFTIKLESWTVEFNDKSLTAPVDRVTYEYQIQQHILAYPTILQSSVLDVLEFQLVFVI